MRSSILRSLAAAAAPLLLSGCMFTQWTDHAFLGSPSDPPTHVDREWACAVILPLAVAGDIITAPIQLVALLITGDYGIYMDRNYSPYGRHVRLIDADDVRLAAGAEGQLRREIDARLAGGAAPGIWAIDAEGRAHEIVLSDAQRTGIESRMRSLAAR